MWYDNELQLLFEHLYKILTIKYWLDDLILSDWKWGAQINFLYVSPVERFFASRKIKVEEKTTKQGGQFWPQSTKVRQSLQTSSSRPE